MMIDKMSNNDIKSPMKIAKDIFEWMVVKFVHDESLKSTKKWIHTITHKIWTSETEDNNPPCLFSWISWYST